MNQQSAEIITNSGKRYKNFRAYHIAIGTAIRYALIDFYKEVKKYAIQVVTNYYHNEFGGSEYYDNTYGMINALESSDDFNGAIYSQIKGNWEGKSEFDIFIDWEYLDSQMNGEGHFGTYTDFDGNPITDKWEELLEKGLPIYKTGIRHSPLNLDKIIKDYVDKNIEKAMDKAIKPYM